MESGKSPGYEVLLTEIAPGMSVELVAGNLAQTFGVERRALISLMSRAPVPVKRGADLVTAIHYAEALRIGGARFEVRRASPPVSAPPLLYFKPIEAIEWPQRCVACFDDDISEEPVELNLAGLLEPREEGAAAGVGGFLGEVAGEAVGAVAGELAGAVGGFVGRAVVSAVVSGASGEEALEDVALSYSLPLCRRCRAAVPSIELEALASASSEMVKISFLTRSAVTGTLCLAIENPDYEEAFRRRNRGLIFDDPQSALECCQTVPFRGDERMGGDGRPLEERLVAHLSTYLPLDGLHLAPEVPRKKMLAAWRFCGVSSSIPVLAVLDLTVIGSAEKCLMLSPQGVHFSNGKSGKPPRGKVTYQELAQREPCLDESGKRLELGPGLTVDLGALDPQLVVEIVRSIRRGLLSPPSRRRSR